MPPLDKLYSKEQIEEWASKRADDAGRLSRQLLDSMRENERLREALEDLLTRHGYTEKDGEWHWEALSNKDSDNG